MTIIIEHNDQFERGVLGSPPRITKPPIDKCTHINQIRLLPQSHEEVVGLDISVDEM